MLSISETIAPIRDRHQLLRVISEQAQSVFNFHDVSLFVLHQNDTYVADWAVTDPALSHSGANSLLRERGAGSITYQDSALEWAVRQCQSNDTPQVITYNEALFTAFPTCLQFETLRQFGYQESLVGLLRQGEQVLGLLMFNAQQADHFSPPQFNLFQGITNQVAMAVSNIQANEENLRREQEKTLLLSISEAIATVRGKADLLKAIMAQVIPLFGGYDCGLFVFNRNRTHLEDLTVSYPLISPSQGIQLMTEQAAALIPYDGSSLAWFMDRLRQERRPLVHNFKDDKLPFWDEFAQGSVIEQIGYEEALCGLLRTQGEELGFFCINSLEKGTFNATQFSLLQAIADQLAVAVSHILANEDILKREQEKTLLLSISEAIATIRDKKQLLNVIERHVRPVFGSQTSGLFLLDADGRYHRDWMVELENTTLDTVLEQTLGSDYRHFGTAIAYVMDQPKAALYDWQQLRQRGHDHPHFPVMFEAGICYAIAGPLRVGGRVIGMFCINATEPNAFRDSQLPLFSTICDQVAVAVSNILANEQILQLKQQLEAEKSYLVEELKTNYNFGEIIGSSAELQRAFQQISLVAPLDSTVLLEGETGTGKELFARAIHDRSPRQGRVMIKINCATLPAQLIESELFGHEKGSFTGATDKRIGKFELAHQGTIFLDEVGELPIELQAKLLRVLQEREFERVGGKAPISTDVRIIAATNRQLAQEVTAGRFRADLYYRLSVFPVHLPALRERVEDIPLLATHFVRKYCQRFKKACPDINQRAMQELLRYDWPGNVRELENVIEQAVIIYRGGSLTWGRVLTGFAPKPGQTPPVAYRASPFIAPTTLKQQSLALEREGIKAALHQSKGRIRGEQGAAALLAIKPTTLEAKMKRLGIEWR